METTATLQSVQQLKGTVIDLRDKEENEPLNQMQNTVSSNTENGRSDIFDVPVEPKDRHNTVSNDTLILCPC